MAEFNGGKTLYLECTSGISGDMSVAALLDLGADQEVLMRALNSVPDEGFSIDIHRVKKAGVDCCSFDVILDAVHENHDHDMAYLHGTVAEQHTHLHEHDHDHDHEHDHNHAHDHDHDHDHEHHHDHDHEHHHDHDHDHDHGHAHHHRSFADVREILAQIDMTERAHEIALKIFTLVAEAESKAHAVPVEEVHFHEVGAIDSIVDIVAAAVCFDNLGIDEVIVPRLNEGQGTVRCAHGILPVPVPAVTNICQAAQLPLHIMQNVQGEFVTPTGAAIAAALRTSSVLPDAFVIEKIGLGAGKRNYERASILRAFLINPADQKKKISESETADAIWKLESNIDDSTGEQLGFAMELLMKAGARDVYFIPIFMKKNRPAYELNVICKEEKIGELEQIIFENTTTIGIRRVPYQRSILQREIREVETPYGTAQCKVCTVNGVERPYPEYESVAKLCRESGVPFQEMYLLVKNAAASSKQD